MNDINEIYKLYKGELSLKEKDLLKRSYRVAFDAHKDQKRASGEPYFNHVFATAKNLTLFGMDATTIAAGFLHDTIEDTDATEETIRKEFGDEVVFLVNGVTKLGTLKYQGRERHVESLRKFFVAVAQDMRVVIIKLADRLHNIRTLEHIKPEKAKRIALETIEIYAPLAYRLAMGRLVSTLQDEAFPFAYPKEFLMVNELMKEREMLNEEYLSKVHSTVKKELKNSKINYIEIHRRVKGRYSLWKKLQKKDMDIEKIYDVVALRIVVPTVSDCYQTLGTIHSIWKPLPGRIKDYIALPKINGYQSIHTTIFSGDGGICEIQIRTEEMHRFAEYGQASHQLYKEKGSIEATGQSIKFLKDIKSLQENESDKNVFMKNLKIDFFGDRLFVFSPLGDVIDLPKGSCAIDFAYAIHGEIGDTAIAANINGKNSALKTVLNNGDIVEIKTNKKATPSTKWLAYVKTTMARRQIERYARENSLWKKMFRK